MEGLFWCIESEAACSYYEDTCVGESEAFSNCVVEYCSEQPEDCDEIFSSTGQGGEEPPEPGQAECEPGSENYFYEWYSVDAC